MYKKEGRKISKKYWEKYFAAHILERGKDYYAYGAVYNLSQNSDGYIATVEGSEKYTVKIKLSNNKIHTMYCTCPYAYDGNHCKHMAAVLYAIEDDKAESSSSNQKKENMQEMKQELITVINRIPEEELRELLVELAEKDISFGNRIITEYSDKCGEQGIIYLKKEVDEICDEYSDRHGFVSYREASDFTSALEHFLYEKVDPLVDKGLLMQAFELTNYVFYRIGNQDMDDSDGGSGFVAGSCSDLWEEILEKADKEEKEKMFRWFMEHQKGYVIDYMEDYIEDILMENFQDEEMLREKMTLLDTEIEKIVKRTNTGSSYFIRHELENNILKRIGIMEQLECSSDEIEEYRSKYRQFPAIRQLEIQEYIDGQQYAKAIKVLKESKKADVAYPGLVDEYSKQLIEIYEQTGDDDNYKKELVYQVFSVYQKDLEYIKKLKKIANMQEWSKWQKQILTSKNTWAIKYSFMESEGMYEELLNDILKSGSVYILNRYEKVLKKKFPDKVCDTYITYAKRQSRGASNRKEYNELAEYLKKIAGYPNGKIKAQELADAWKQEYRKRPAMMDEIRKAGF